MVARPDGVFEVNGVQMKAGDRCLIRFDSANRDDEQFPNGDQLQFDPPRGGNAGFGLGIHRCIGAHLGRVQIGIAFENYVEAGILRGQPFK